jgi:ABC-type Mn2+/Zn2+ transport system ATPase subunit
MTTPSLHLAYGQRHFTAPIANAAALQIRDLYVAHRHNNGSGWHQALNGISLTVGVGQRVALIGANGAGKSSLLKAIAGLLPIRSGQIQIYGLAVGVCHHRVAYLPQRGEIDWRFPITLRNFVVTGRYVHLGWLRRPSQADFAIADSLIERLQLGALAHRQLGELSGGQQQRAMLARALAQQGDLLMLDEPLNAVDADTKAIMADVLAAQHSAGKTYLVATHDLARLNTDFDLVVRLEQGQLAAAS